ncbi:MAG: ABC transporter ATP-binding protein/permease [Christensenellaceae bacterium]|jgi:ATP-binding cassette subfamily B protein|nr:ABC transporter ATP-binding protein/permease [Christensenellaceae bacterium]
MLKLIFRFKGWEWLILIVAFGAIAAGVWVDLKLPDFLAEMISILTPANGVMTGTMTDILINGGLMLACAFGSMFITIFVSFAFAFLSSRMQIRLRYDIISHVMNFSQAEVNKFSIPSLMTRTTNDLYQIRMFVAMALQVMIKAPLTAIWAILKILGKSAELSTITFSVVVMLLLVVALLIIIVIPRYRKIQTLTDNLNGVAREGLTGLRVVRAYNAESFQEEKFDKHNKTLSNTFLTVNRAMGAFMPFINLVLGGMGLAIYWYGASLLNMGKVDLGNLMTFQNYSVQIIFSFIMLIFVFIMLPRALVSAKRINEVFNTSPTIVSAKNPITPTEKGTLEFKNVSFKYPDGKNYIIRDINLKVKRGETLAFIGATGSGKTTLVNLLPRLYDASEGEVLVDGVNVKDYDLKTLHNIVGIVPQTTTLFRGTIESNLAFGVANGAIDEAAIKKAIDIAQAAEFIDNLPKKLKSKVAQGGKNFSGGQKQRISIARVIARNPEIIIFDDSLSALDYKTDRKLREALKKQLPETTIVQVAQRIGTIKEADQIIVLDKGKIVGVGKHKDLLKNCAVYEEIALSQLSKEEL